MTNYCHLSYEDRKNIEDGLNENKSINQIAKEINRSHSSILREINRNKKYSKTDYETISCERLNHSPYVCNGCHNRSICTKAKFIYYAREAQNTYEELIKSCRQGINLNYEEIYKINEIITPLIKKGQTINHLYINHPDILNFCKSSFYRYINNGIFEFGPLDFPRMVKYKKRKNNPLKRTRQEREILKGRTYYNFLDYINKNPDLNIVEMDTVEGLNYESDCLLTLFWRKTNFMLIFKLKSQTTEEVTKIFDIIQNIIPIEDYKRLFPIILTDNGHEFFDVNNLEYHHQTKKQVSKVFYCNPSCSWQKGSIEKNHEFIRYILPKGSSFKNLTQEDCNLCMNNINSLCRDSLCGKSPYEAMLFLCPKNILNKLHCYYIKPNNVILNNSLLQ